jgi:voltage-gated potassium channel
MAVTFTDLLAGSDCEVEELQLSDSAAALGPLNGLTLGELDLGRRTGALVLAVRLPAASPGLRPSRGTESTGRERTLITNPGRDLQLGPGQLLVVMGSQAQLQAVTRILGSALRSVEHLPG